MAIAPTLSPAAIAVNRFGLGARPGEPLPDDPRGWLIEQADPRLSAWQPTPPALNGQPSSAALAAQFAERQRALRDASDADKPAVRRHYGEQIRDVYRNAVDARLASALTTNAPFIERLVHFWANHFAVSIEKPPVAMLAGSFENEAIRPHVLGRFEDMLIAAERHPAMQIFLDQARSVGPDSPAAMRAAMKEPSNKPGNKPGNKRGLNENLAREMMELHTLGVRSGYTQADVTEFARALTGWSLGAMNANAASSPGEPTPPGAFVFRPRLHEPGARTLMGKQYAQPDEAQPLAVLHDLATAQATARHIAYKLARHFVADTPPPTLVDRLASVFDDTGGDLPSVYRALIDAPQAWQTAPAKFKTPWDWTVSSLRGLRRTDLQGMRAAPLLAQLGQPVWRPGSPAGYDDVAASWAAPDALVRRVELAQRFAARFGTPAGDALDARSLGPQLLAGSVSEATASAVARAESAPTALALLLVSPDFLRR
jgi:uncharacterized protein (DUF1800 family)